MEFNIQNIDNAIRKSKTDREYTIYRGVTDLSWLKNANVGGTFTEKAFGSFTLDLNRALRYSNPENPIIFQLETEKGTNMLYVDRSENEILRPRESTYEIKKIQKIYLRETTEHTIYKIEMPEE
ncbi:ADP-ribosyltransferase [Methanimicrococcus hacksteinii]|uniref:ADP-ribosyltransferase n=1 Tax=Methanimicrococcus hacksteinii TaxID=3028293 RepID=UPI003B968083